MTTVFNRLADGMEKTFSAENIQADKHIIANILDAVDNSLEKAQAFLAMLEASVEKLKGNFETNEAAADAANDKIAAVAAEGETSAS